jgi:hypothetical protein
MAEKKRDRERGPLRLTAQTFNAAGIFSTGTEKMVDMANAFLTQEGVRNVSLSLQDAYGSAKFLTLTVKIGDDPTRDRFHIDFIRLVPRLGLGRRKPVDETINTWIEEHPSAQLETTRTVATVDGLAATQLFVLWKSRDGVRSTASSGSSSGTASSKGRSSSSAATRTTDQAVAMM